MQVQKQKIRLEIIAKCKEISSADRVEYEALAFKHLQPLLEAVSSIVIYHAYTWEFSLNRIIEFCLQNGKKLYQPLAYRHSRHMGLIPYSPTEQEVFSEPDYIPSNQLEWYNVDLIIVPLVAVDSHGHRLGKGGGYYDTTLAGVAQPQLCGIGYSCQIVEGSLPQERFDLSLDYFVSNIGLTNFYGK